MKKIYRFIKEIVEHNQLALMASATSFYIIVALFSFSILGFQVYNLFSNDFENFLVSKLFDVVNPLYQSIFSDMKPIFNLNSFSIFIFINLLWSSSKVINGVNTIADIVYEEVKDRKGILNRFSSFCMFLMLVIVVFFEIGFALYANNIIDLVIKNAIFLRVIQFIIEMFLIFFTLTLLYIYAPPVKMKFKMVTYGSTISTVLIYLSSFLFVLVIRIYQRLNISYGILTIISLFFLWIYIINWIIAFGIVINYRHNKYGIISQNKKPKMVNTKKGYKKE